MKNLVLTVVSALAAAALACALMTWNVRRDVAALERRQAELEAQRAPYQALEEQLERFEATRRAIELGRSLVGGTRARQASAAALLSAMALTPDSRVERVALTPDGGEISGRADSPVAASEVGERLAARGLLEGFELKRFERGVFTLAFTLPQAAARQEAGR